MRLHTLFFIFPEIFHPISHLLLLWTTLCVPKACTLEYIGHKLLFDEMVGKIMCILISFAISQIVHQFGWSIAQVQWYWQIACFLDQF